MTLSIASLLLKPKAGLRQNSAGRFVVVCSGYAITVSCVPAVFCTWLHAGGY